MREFNTIRIQYYLYTNGQYCLYEIENRGFLKTHELEEISAYVLAVIPDELLMQIRVLRFSIDANKGVVIYLTAMSGIGPDVFALLKEKFFEKIFICKEDSKTDIYIACFRHK
jgi:hypothetical protein